VLVPLLGTLTLIWHSAKFSARDRPTFGNYVLAEPRFAMKLMGISKLAELAHRAGEALDGAVPALVAELEAGTWHSMTEIADFFPSAVVDGIKVRIPLNGGYRVDLLADCEAQMILIEYAGAGSGARAGKARSKAA
jgi:hypothetical protein